MNTEKITYKSIVLATAFILLLPLVAMQFADEVVWDLADFVAAGTLLFGTGLTYKLTARIMSGIVYRAAVGVALAAMFLLIWVSLAVGIFGSPDPFEAFPSLVVGSIGAILARFQPHGMSRALIATAAVQALAAVIALVGGSASPEYWMREVLLNGFFIALFVGSALLFRHAAREQTSADIR